MTRTPNPTAMPASVPATPVVSVRNLAKQYGKVTALDGLDLTVPPRSVVGFLGPNGAGKTTAMRILTGLARRSGGEIAVFGMDVERDGPQVRSRIGFLAQEPRFYEHLTPRETLTLCLSFYLAERDAASERRRIDEALDLVGLTAAADRPVRGFSGGQRQRLGIAQATVHDPDLLIMDEPAAALDPAGRAAVLAILERLRERTTVLFSTHILDDVDRIADRVTIVNSGRTIAEGAVEELRAGSAGVRYDLRLRGPAERTIAALRDESWVTDVVATRALSSSDVDATDLEVTVTDADAAEAVLLRRVLADPEVRVTSFRRYASTLERVFLELTNDDDRDRNGASA